MPRLSRTASDAAAPPAVPEAGAAVLRRPRGRPRKALDAVGDGNRRQELIRAAAALFRRQGFDATSTRDIAAAAGMRSGSPFYHFDSKQALLHAVMAEGMHDAIEQQRQVLQKAEHQSTNPRWVLGILIRNHFDVLLGPGSDFIPVMLYESRAITPAQRAVLAELQGVYEAPWVPVLEALHTAGALRADVKLARLLMFGALNWSVQWYDARKGASLEELTRAALALFLQENA
jgi:AcrR family transcriptional regulator